MADQIEPVKDAPPATPEPAGITQAAAEMGKSNDTHLLASALGDKATGLTGPENFGDKSTKWASMNSGDNLAKVAQQNFSGSFKSAHDQIKTAMLIV